MPEMIASGDWWSLDNEGLLEIFCVGSMPTREWYNYQKRIDYRADILTVNISDGVSSISDNAFSERLALTSVTIPDSVSSIGDFAFISCRALTGVTIPNGVTTIGDYAFDYCLALTSVTIPNGVTSIGMNAFYHCDALTSVTLPASVSNIGDYAFDTCPALTSVTIQNGVISIGDGAFSHCNALTGVTIPDSVISIGKNAFSGCSALASVTISRNITTIADGTFLSCVSLTNVTIPDGVTSIGSVALNDCASLTSVTIPDSVTSIGTFAFSFSSGLTDAYYTGTETQWNAMSVGRGNDYLLNANIHFNYRPPPPPDTLRIGSQYEMNLVADSTEVSYISSVSLDGNELQSDEIYITVRRVQDPEAFLAELSGVNRSTPVWYVRSDRNQTLRTEKYYWKPIERVGKYDFVITAQSPIGRLTSDFAGDLYSGEPLPNVIAAVIGGVIPYTTDERLRAVRVYGWAPYQSRRETLHMLALAYGFIVRRDSACNPFFTLPDSVPVELSDDFIFRGGSVDYAMGGTYARIDVTEYAFLRTENDREVTLFDNTDGAPAADRQLVKFSDAPVYGLSASEGLTLHSSGVNCAVVSGVGVLTGKPYAKITSVLSLNGDSEADPDAVLSIDNIPLITSLNSETVAAKYRESVNAPAVVTMDFIRRAENAGDCVSFVDPYGAARVGYLLSMSGSVTSIDRVSARFLTGYAHHFGNTYNRVLTLTGSGSWTVPASLDGADIRVVLISGGQGGASGQHGTDDTASGGGRGFPGSGGKVNVVKIAVSAGQTFDYASGAGGAGGVPSGDYDTDEDGRATYRNNPGAIGAASLFALTEDGEVIRRYSSDRGSYIAVGYHDDMEGVQYAVSGPDNGVDGGAATSARESDGRDNPVWTDVQRPTVALPWDSGQSWISGDVGAGKTFQQTGENAFQEWSYGGLGGGAAVGADGADGQDASPSSSLYYADTGGNGGNGADASPLFPSDTRSYGSGGSGGHGGGEGGAGGSGNSTEVPNMAEDGRRGFGGAGSAGQDGADGCIYWKDNS